MDKHDRKCLFSDKSPKEVTGSQHVAPRWERSIWGYLSQSPQGPSLCLRGHGSLGGREALLSADQPLNRVPRTEYQSSPNHLVNILTNYSLSPHTQKQPCEVMYVLTSLIVVIISIHRYIKMSSSISYIYTIFVNHTSIKLKMIIF